MSEQPRAVPGDIDDELQQRITRALRSRDDAPVAVAAHVEHIEARLAEADQPLAPVSHLARRGGKVVAAGVVVSALAVYGAGAAAAANPYSGGARALENVAQAVGLDWSAMPAGYTRAQYETFWGAGYTAADVETLGALWHTDATETKARAGQLILDGSAVPIAPGQTGETSPGVEPTQAQQDALRGAGYTEQDIETLSGLWHSDELETKAHAGQLILDGQRPPIAPGG